MHFCELFGEGFFTCPSVLSLNNLKLHKTLALKKLCKKKGYFVQRVSINRLSNNPAQSNISLSADVWLFNASPKTSYFRLKSSLHSASFQTKNPTCLPVKTLSLHFSSGDPSHTSREKVLPSPPPQHRPPFHTEILSNSKYCQLSSYLLYVKETFKFPKR